MTVEYGGAINKTVGEYATRITIFPWPKERQSCLVTFQKASHTDTQTEYICIHYTYEHLYIICLSRGVMATTTTTTGCKTKIKRGRVPCQSSAGQTLLPLTVPFTPGLSEKCCWRINFIFLFNFLRCLLLFAYYFLVLMSAFWQCLKYVSEKSFKI